MKKIFLAFDYEGKKITGTGKNDFENFTGEVFIKVSSIVAISRDVWNNKKTNIHSTSDTVFNVSHSIDEVIEYITEFYKENEK